MSSTASPQSRAPGFAAAISVRRFANDEIARVGSSLDDLDEGHQFEFLCECGDLSCNQFVRITVAEYHAAAPGSVVGHPVPGRVHVPEEVSRAPLPDAATLVAANAHIFHHVRDSDDGKQEWEFVCECGKERCHEHVFLTLDGYVALRERGVVVLADGHSQSQIERARRLREEAEALTRQAEHQTRRARRNMGREGVSDERR